MEDISVKYFGKTWDETMGLSETEIKELQDKAKKDNEMLFDYLANGEPTAFTCYLYCKENGITAQQLIEGYEQSKNKFIK